MTAFSTSAQTPQPLPTDALYRICDHAILPFDTTAELPDSEEAIGQDRAVEAIRFAIGMKHRGFNLFALGPEGTGRRSLVMRFLTQAAGGEDVPDEWIYVNNFEESHKPRAIRMPKGRANAFRKDMEQLVEELGSAIPAAFEAEEYRERRDALEAELKEHQDAALKEISEKAQEKGVAVIRTAVGLALAPTRDGEVLTPEQFGDLPEDEQDHFKTEMENLQSELEVTVRDMPHWERETRRKLRELDNEVLDYAVSHLMDEVRGKYDDLPDILDYLETVADDVAENVDDFLDDESEDSSKGEDPPSDLRRYRVNVLVNHAETTGAPVVFEDHPVQPNLIGRIEHIAQYGALVTDFNLIKAGSLHRANGGYLIIDARKLMLNPYAWEDLKRALKSREISIESPGQSTGVMSTVTLEPQPIPLEIKVVLIGDPMLYYLLSQNDPEFAELFKVAADFDWRMDRTAENAMALARSVATQVRREGLRPLDRGAVARMIEHSARTVEDSEKLSTHMASLADLVRESDYWAGRGGADLIIADHVDQAIRAAIYRQDRVRENVQEEMRRGVVHVATEGAVIGQINGLAVLELGNFSFGRPSRITARVRIGRGDVVDIEREVELGGPLHGKGVMILSSFLSSHYAADTPLSLSASLVFEQSYGGIDGDSASSTELYALLSALAEAPIRQGLAVTGSVDQFGRVQAIGGVNEKIEGFFDLCSARGLTGDQGVLIPATNVPHLMLRRDVVDACRQGQFAVYPVQSIDQGMELLTGLPAGQLGMDGRYPPGTVNRRIQVRLAAFSRRVEELDNPRNGNRVSARNNG